MKSASRKYLKCVFCDNSNITREHIFTRALCKRLDIKSLGTVSKIPFPEDPESLDKQEARRQRKKQGEPLSLTSHSICGRCNHELGKEVDQSIDLLESFIRGKCRKISASKKPAILRYFQRIGILHDLETCAFDPNIMTESKSDIAFNTSHHVKPRVISDELLASFKKGNCLPYPRVYLSRHTGVFGNVAEMNSLPEEIWTDEGGGVTRKFMFCLKKTICSDMLR